MSHKNFKDWHKKKEKLQQRISKTYFYEREVWWIAVGVNLGDEEDGKGANYARPVLVIRKFNRNLFYGLPLSSTTRRGSYYCEINLSGRKSAVLLSQMKALDAKRLISKIETIDRLTYRRVVSGLKNIL